MVFEEYERFKGATSLENSQLLKSVLPMSTSLTSQNRDMQLKAIESDLLCKASYLDFTDNSRAEDKRFIGKRNIDSKINMVF